LLLLWGCASEAPQLVEEPSYEAAPSSALVVITQEGLEPAELRLDHQGVVLFWNATGADLVVVAIESGSEALVAPRLAEGFRLAGGKAVSEPPLAPGTAAVLAVPAGSDLRYEVSGRVLRRGRIVREGP
tara:strand:+ start:467 stop:853 length:387 start_codon:yes stop_codon:yes gene_type:complete